MTPIRAHGGAPKKVDCLHIALDISPDDKTTISMMFVVTETQNRFSKRSSDNNPKSVQQGRLYDVEVQDEKGVVLDSIDVALPTRPSKLVHGVSDGGKIQTRIATTFPLVPKMKFLAIKRSGKNIYLAKIVSTFASLELELQKQSDYFGLSKVRAFVSGYAIKEGNEKVFFEGLLKATDGCSDLKSESKKSCELTNARAVNGIKLLAL